MANLNSKKVVNATKWSLITEIFAKLISPFTNMVLARLLVPEAFGAVATITMIITFADVFTDAGFQKYIVQHEFKDDDDFDLSVNVAFWSNFILSSIIVLAIFIFRKPLAIMVGSPELDVGIAVSSVAILLHAFSSIQMAVYRRNFDFKTLFFVRIFLTATPVVVTIPMAILLRNFWALIIGTLAMNTVQAVILTLRSKWKIKFRYSFKKFKEMFSFTIWSLFESIAIWLTSYAGTFIVGRTLSAYYLGLYKTSITTVNSFLAIITSAIMSVMFVALSRCQNDDLEFNKVYFNFQRIISIISVPMGVGIFLFSDLVTLILLGEHWMEASTFLGLFALSTNITVFIINISGNVYRSKGKPRVSFVAQMIYFAMLVPALHFSALAGYKPLYLTRAFIAFPYMFLTLFIQQKWFGIKIKDVIKNVFPPILSASVMWIFGVLVKSIFGGIVWQFFTIFLCVVVYFSIIFMFPDVRKTILGIDKVKKIISKIKFLRLGDKSDSN